MCCRWILQQLTATLKNNRLHMYLQLPVVFEPIKTHFSKMSVLMIVPGHIHMTQRPRISPWSNGILLLIAVSKKFESHHGTHIMLNVSEMIRQWFCLCLNVCFLHVWMQSSTPWCNMHEPSLLCQHRRFLSKLVALSVVSYTETALHSSLTLWL